jgi:hypothetical protein
MKKDMTETLGKMAAASAVMDDYYTGLIDKDAAIATLAELEALDWVECGSPWDENGDFLCTGCMANTITAL